MQKIQGEIMFREYLKLLDFYLELSKCAWLIVGAWSKVNENTVVGFQVHKNIFILDISVENILLTKAFHSWKNLKLKALVWHISNENSPDLFEKFLCSGLIQRTSLRDEVK